MSTIPSSFTLAASFPTATHTALYTAIFIGLGLWLFGRRLARTTCSMVGLLAGLAIGLAVASGVAGNDMALLTIILCSLGGAVLAWLLYRIWMSLSLATLLALAGPVTLLVWQGVAVMPAMKNSSSLTASASAAPAPSHSTKTANAGTPATQPQNSSPAPTASTQTSNPSATQPSANASVSPQPKTSSPTIALAAVKQDSSFELSAADALHSLSSDQISSVLQMASAPTNFLKTSWVQDVLSYVLSIRSWYPKLTQRQQDLGVLLAAGGAIIGLITGLAFPQFAASVVSSLVGASLIVPAGYRLLMPYLPAQVLNHSGPRWALLAVSLITLLGLFIQWTTKRRPTDK